MARCVDAQGLLTSAKYA